MATEQERREAREAREALRAEWRAARGTFHRDVHLNPSRWARFAWVAAGVLSAIIGVAGVLLPILPGTPFLVLSAVCWVRSSSRLYVALLENRWMGPTLYQWRKTGTLEPRFRLMILATLVVSVAVSAIFIAPGWASRAFVLGFGVVAFILVVRIRTVPRETLAGRDGRRGGSRR